MVTEITQDEGTSNLIRVPAGRTVVVAYSTADLADAVFSAYLSEQGTSGPFQLKATLTGDGEAHSGSFIVENTTKSNYWLRFTAVEVPEGTFAGTVTITLTTAAIELYVLRDPVTDVPLFRVTTEGFEFLNPVSMSSSLSVAGALSPAADIAPTFEEVTTLESPAETDCDISVYETRVTSGDSDGAELLNIGDGTGAYVGQRHLITLVSRVGTDDVTLDDANITQAGVTIAAVVLDADDEFILLEWQGASWEVIAAASGVVVPV